MRLESAFLLALAGHCLAATVDDIFGTRDPLEHPFYEHVVARIYENNSLPTDIEGRIVGGDVAAAGQFPYAVGLHMRQMLTVFVCGGSLVKFNWVLTAAHCIYDFNRITVMVGTTNRVRGPFGFTADVTSQRHIFPHPRYDPSNLQNDIGLIFMATARESLLNHQLVGLIALPQPADAHINLVGRVSTVSGFGATSDGPNRQPSDVLRFVSMPVMSNLQCRVTFGGFVLDSNVCTDTTGGRSPCVGDSGGPLTAEIEPGRTVVIGVVSFGHSKGCGLGFPAVFVRVTSFLDWIEETVSGGWSIQTRFVLVFAVFVVAKML